MENIINLKSKSIPFYLVQATKCPAKCIEHLLFLFAEKLFNADFRFRLLETVA